MDVRGNMMMAATAAVLLSGVTPADAACNSSNAFFEDNFEFMDPSWGEPDATFYVKDGVLVVKKWRSQVNLSTRNEVANACADVTITDAPDPTSSPAGLVFWWQDWQNYYYVFYWATGDVEVRRILQGKL